MKTKNMIIISVVIALFAVLVLAHFETSPNMAIDSGLNISEVIVMAKDTQNGATISGINLSGTVIFNISVNNTNGTNGLAGWNVTNISIMFNHTNSSIVGNFSTNNLSNNQLYFNISIDTTELEDGVYTLMGMISNYTGGSIGTGESPRTNYTLAVNVSIDNSPPNVTLPSESSLRVFSRNLTGMDVNQSFNITVSDETFYELNDNNGTNVENVTFSFTNATGTGFNVTVPNATAVNTTSAVWGVLYNISALHGGSHTVRVFAYNYHGKLNDSVVFNFTVNSAHNVTLHPGVGDYVTQGANYSAINTTVLFNASVINATGTTSKGGWIGAPTGRSPIAAVIFMFNNGSGTAFNISNTSNAIAGQYWNISFNVSNLAEGDHTVTVFANDTLGNYNKTESFSFVVDKSGPGISIVCDTGKTVGESVLCTCTSEAGSGSGIKEAAKFLGETGNTKTVTHSSAGTFSSSTCSY